MFTAIIDRLFHGRRPPPSVPADTALADAGAAPRVPPSTWPAARLALVEALWGEGFNWPGGVAETRRLVAPFGLTAANSVLLVGVGPGGPARSVAADFGAWVTGAEEDPQLLEVAKRRIQRAGAALAKRATMVEWDPFAPSFPRRAFHHALLFDALSGGKPSATLAAAVGAVKPGGQIIIIQAEPADGELAEAIERGLTMLGADIRLRDDESDRYSRLVLQGWRNHVRSLAEARPGSAEAEVLVNEAAHWLQRVRQIRDRSLRMVRTVAIVGQGFD